MPDLSAIRRRVGSFTLGVAILVLIALVGVVASIFFATRFVEDTIGLVVANLANRSGLSVFLVRAVVIIGTIPFFWAVGKFTRNIWGLLNLGWDSMALYKNKYGLVVVGYIGLYFLAMYWASTEAYAYKYCADTREGIWTSDSPGKDPVYGVELKPCSLAQVETLRVKNGRLRPPREILIKDAEKYAWFDPVTAQPQVWYSSVSSYGYRFFDNRGIDPHNSQELKPVTPEIVERIKRQQASQAAAQKQAEEQALDAKRREDAARDDAAEQSQRDLQVGLLAQQAQAAFDDRDYKSAFDTCVQALQISAANQTCTTIKQHASLKLADQLVSQGQSHFERGEFDEAVWSAEKALDVDPANQNAVRLKKLAIQMKPHAVQ
jgi:tetratricopeptide (TPR) repeat protein